MDGLRHYRGSLFQCVFSAIKKELRDKMCIQLCNIGECRITDETMISCPLNLCSGHKVSSNNIGITLYLGY